MVCFLTRNLVFVSTQKQKQLPNVRQLAANFNLTSLHRQKLNEKKQHKLCALCEADAGQARDGEREWKCNIK